MGVDLTGGLADAREFVFPAQPDDPDMRESVNVWVWDDDADFGFPRVGVEAVADQWETHDQQVNIAFADGRVLLVHEPGKVHDPMSADGRPRVLGAGALSFELLEPFRRWRLRLAGDAVETTVDAQMAGQPPDGGTRVPVELELDIRSAVPPWENGALVPEAARVLDEQEEGALMGGPRFEQLFQTTGTFRVDGETREVHGGGLRIRRQGIRRLARFWGHAWQSSVFPSGRAFGYIAYPPRDDGKATYNEGYLFEGEGGLIPATIVDAPWLRRMQPRGEDVSVTLETARGTTTIRGETRISTFSAIGTETGTFPILHQAVVRYSWDGESANGMMERSMPPDRVERP
jgi:prepilin-type processing-associated H-X9-DG protein